MSQAHSAPTPEQPFEGEDPPKGSVPPPQRYEAPAPPAPLAVLEGGSTTPTDAVLVSLINDLDLLAGPTEVAGTGRGSSS